ncbi:hypothetical protein Sgly_1061 [Syntrophobotulus glycolicus DSM 8271]|uniref:Uncharacterized protein n=1 Tax=Syntrophobotulus glycolicus (strain DSM 8271 / FlGlyR) TaxID=645991 RepID=F0STU9_SYNGF|nr:hypothetical protein [Syntrophobotulus glycolicus]ADY55389.1 hypothetical protein Sgly_1061 [Syntrophobotulus glycolicus DSM 8271]
MTLSKKIEQALQDELKQENIKTVIEIAEFLKFKETQQQWNKINESEPKYITETERAKLNDLKSKGEFVEQRDLLDELGIHEDEI